MDAITLIGAMSVLSAGLCISIGGIGPGLGEGNAAASALRVPLLNNPMRPERLHEHYLFPWLWWNLRLFMPLW